MSGVEEGGGVVYTMLQANYTCAKAHAITLIYVFSWNK